MSPTTDKMILDNEPVQVLVVGPYKSGKTWGALTFPRPNFMDFDRGIITARNPNFVAKYGLRSIQYEQFRDKFDAHGVPTAHDAFDAACRYFDEWMGPGKRDRFDTWVIDSGTSLSKASAYKGIMILADKGFAGAKSNTYDLAKKYGLVVLKKQDYGAERSQVEQFVQMVKDSGKHLVFVCHQKDEYNDAGSIVAQHPLLTGQSKQVVPAMFHEVYFMRTKPVGMEYERYIQTEADGLRSAGSRLGVPSGIAWDYDAIRAALDTIKEQHTSQAQEAKEK